MPFSSTDSLTSTNMNNMLRGLYRDNSDYSVTGTTNETDLASTTITGGTIGATGCLHVLAAGTITGSAGNKRIRLYLGSTALVDSTSIAGTADWSVDVWIFNTASNAQRVIVVFHSLGTTTTTAHDYITAAVDTSTSQTMKITGTLTSGSDTITQTMFDVFVVQIT